MGYITHSNQGSSVSSYSSILLFDLILNVEYLLPTQADTDGSGSVSKDEHAGLRLRMQQQLDF